MSALPVTRGQVVAAARRWLGTPYHHQASLCDVGCDCLGLVRGVWRELYGSEPQELPPYSHSWAESGGGEALAQAATRHLVPKPSGAAREGDVLLFRWRETLPVKHCAILSAPGRIIHAHDGAAVSEVALTPWWRRHLSHVFSFPEVRD